MDFESKDYILYEFEESDGSFGLAMEDIITFKGNQTTSDKDGRELVKLISLLQLTDGVRIFSNNDTINTTFKYLKHKSANLKRSALKQRLNAIPLLDRYLFL